MFKHILLPIDGAAASQRIARKGILLANALGARVTAIYVLPPYPLVYAADSMVVEQMPTPAQFRRDSQAIAKKYLELLANVAKKAGVTCATKCVNYDQPHAAIIKIARAGKCDLIVMRASTRKPISLRLIESETRKVLGSSKIPLLIFH